MIISLCVMALVAMAYPGGTLVALSGERLSGFLSSAHMELGVLLGLPRGVSPRLEWGPARVLSSRAVAAVSRWLKTLCGVGAGT